MSDRPEINFDKLSTYSLFDRKSLVSSPTFASPDIPPPGAFEALMASVPDILAGKSLRVLVDRMRQAHLDQRPVVWGLGGHVIKVGLGPILIDLMERGYVSSLVLNGAAAIHDVEVGLCGATSEDVAEGIRDGSFGMARETAEILNQAANRAAKESRGLGETLAEDLSKADISDQHPSVLRACGRAGIPVTVHVAIGQDIVHMHGNADGASIGASTLCDFRRLSGLLSELQGGVYLNVGSAVALPEVFLKALCIARNAGYKIDDFTTANLDMLAHYRPRVNVLQRPGGVGIDLRGHHEIMVPLIRFGLLSELSS